MKLDISDSSKPIAIFLANPDSPHLKFWLDGLGREYRAVIVSIEKSIDESLLTLENVQLISPGFVKYIPIKPLKYLILGLWLRKNSHELSNTLVHAHNASGYGLTALASGLKYAITTFGSEIFKTNSKNISVYNYLIKAVLENAEKITCSSMIMEDFLKLNYIKKKNSIVRIPQPDLVAVERDENLFSVLTNKFSGYERIVISNRRAEPLYRIRELVQQFSQFVSKDSNICLIVLEGATTSDYYELLKQEFLTNEHIYFVDGFLSKPELYSYLALSDALINAPVTDQLSSSILEGLNFGLVCGLSIEPKYAELESLEPIWIENGDFLYFYKIISEMTDVELMVSRGRSLDYYQNEFHPERIVVMVQDFYKSLRNLIN